MEIAGKGLQLAPRLFCYRTALAFFFCYGTVLTFFVFLFLETVGLGLREKFLKKINTKSSIFTIFCILAKVAFLKT